MAANGLITDLYQLTMANALFKKGMHERRVVFDRFYRKNPFNGGYTVVAGLAHLQEFAENFRFDDDDIAYLKSLGIFYPEFLDYLADFRFTGDIYAMPEGTVAFPGELLLRFHGTTTEAMLMETGLSMIMNHESLIATKTRRVRTVAGKDALMEFGLRRAQGPDAGTLGAALALDGTALPYAVTAETQSAAGGNRITLTAIVSPTAAQTLTVLNNSGTSNTYANSTLTVVKLA